MKVFLSWSGESSKYIATTLKDWLPRFLQAVEPWISSHMDKGLVWDNEISKELNETKAGILCLTPDNLDSPYLHYEAGAISNVPGARIYTFLYNLDAINVKQPLSRFQNTKNEREDIFQLVKTINAKLRDSGETYLSDEHLLSNFELFFPLLEEKLVNTPAPIKAKPKRSDNDLLEELLSAVRGMQVKEMTAKDTSQILRFEESPRALRLLQEMDSVLNTDDLTSAQGYEYFKRESQRQGILGNISAGKYLDLVSNYLRSKKKE